VNDSQLHNSYHFTSFFTLQKESVFRNLFPRKKTLPCPKNPVHLNCNYIFFLYNFIYFFCIRVFFNSKVLTGLPKYSIVAVNRKGSDMVKSSGNSMPETSGGNGKD
jgi:hypothetical protein